MVPAYERARGHISVPMTPEDEGRMEQRELWTPGQEAQASAVAANSESDFRAVPEWPHLLKGQRSLPSLTISDPMSEGPRK